MPSRTPDGTDDPSSPTQVDLVADLLSSRRHRRAEHDWHATQQVTKLISGGHGSGDRLAEEISSALSRAAEEITTALHSDEGPKPAAMLDPERLTRHLARASEALNLADVLATVLSASTPSRRRTAS